MALRVSTQPEAIDVDVEFVRAMKTYIDLGNEEIACIAAEFLDVVLCDSKVAADVRVDDFLSLQGPMLCQW
jgi:hypothetical protein